MLFLLGILSGIAGWFLATSTQVAWYGFLPITLALVSTLTLHQYNRSTPNAMPPTQRASHDAARRIIQRIVHPDDLPPHGPAEPLASPTTHTILVVVLGALVGATILHTMV